MIKYLMLILFVVLPRFASGEPVHHCTAEAIAQAKKLLDFHFGPDNRTEIDKNVILLKPIKNPAGKGKFDVLEIYGHIYKGTYRMHLIYAQTDNQCLLVGQEILEMTNL
ncbi:MAG: hypothetical protein ACXWFI_11410 [Methylobacter sp.]